MKLLEVLVVFCGLLPETRRYSGSSLWSDMVLSDLKAKIVQILLLKYTLRL